MAAQEVPCHCVPHGPSVDGQHHRKRPDVEAGWVRSQAEARSLFLRVSVGSENEMLLNSLIRSLSSLWAAGRCQEALGHRMII